MSNLIEVRFTKDFEPYHTHKGDRKQVARGTANRLYRIWAVIENPDSVSSPPVSCYWFQSHAEYNGCSVEHAVSSISLAAQCSYDDAVNLLVEWMQTSGIREEDGKIRW